jgi:class 3 adenylate cyclase
MSHEQCLLSDDPQQYDRQPNSASMERRKIVAINADSNLVRGNRPRLSPRSESSSSGRRSLVTSMRLQRQGFVGRVRSSDFALKSIRRGSSEWHATLRPFVADIAFESIIQRRYQSETVSFRPFTCYAAVLFVDLSNYSAITAAIAARGAHALSNVVNDYLSRLLKIVGKYGGDVIKFAGDAVLVVWYSVTETDLPINSFTAAKCVLEMQNKAGEHPVDGTSLQFRIHCGLSCGLLESEVFSAPNHVNMQRLFHSVGGDALVELSDLVDLAKAGEVCISNGVAEHLGSKGIYRECSDVHGNYYKVLTGLLECKINDIDDMDVHILESLESRQRNRQRSMEEEFIHPTVIKLLSHGGLSPMQISQMRNLCVLFIAMTSSIGSSVNWLMEVQAILDKHRCPSKCNAVFPAFRTDLFVSDYSKLSAFSCSNH